MNEDQKPSKLTISFPVSIESSARNRYGNYTRFHRVAVRALMPEPGSLPVVQIDAEYRDGVLASSVSLTVGDARQLRHALDDALKSLENRSLSGIRSELLGAQADEPNETPALDSVERELIGGDYA
jgi:hypothetical protein